MNLLRLLCCMFPALVLALDTVTLVNPQQQVDETASGVDLLYARYGNGSGAITADIQVTSTGGVLGVDYGAPQPATLAWADGDLTPRTVHLPIINVPGHTPDRDVTVGLANLTGALPGVQWPSVSIQIIDRDPDPAGGLVFLAPAPSGNMSVQDDAGTISLQVQRTGGTSGVHWLTLALSDQNTQAGVDYTAPISTTLNWADGEGGAKSLDLALLPRSQALGTRVLYVSWSAGSCIPTGQGWTISITDHLPALAGTLSVPSTMSAAENAGSLSVAVGRSGGSSGAVSVDWSIVEDTALSGVNYGGPTSGTLSWNAGDGSAKNVVIPLIDDGVPHPPRTAYLVFANPFGGLLIPDVPPSLYVYPGQIGCALTITNANHQGLIGFTQTSATRSELGGSVSFTVTRSDGSTGAIAVDWTTSTSGPYANAIAGTDFTASSGTLHWNSGDTSSRTVTVPILHASGTQPDRQFWLLLQNPQGGAGIDDDHGWAAVTITDVDGSALDTLAMVLPAVSVHELAGSVTISCVRSGGGVGPAGLQLLTDSVSAQPVLQYGTPSASVLTWADGELGVKSFTIPIIHDGQILPSADFRVLAGNSYGNAALVSSHNLTTVSILDDDGPPATSGSGAAAPTAAAGGGCGAGMAGCLLCLLSCIGWRRQAPPRA